MDYVKDLRKLVGHMPIMYPVVSLIIYKDKKILLQRRSDNGKWSLHGGGMNIGEKYIDALRREIKEELNIEVLEPKLFGIYSGSALSNIYPNGDEVYYLNHVFICDSFIGNIEFIDNEVKDYRWFDVDSLPSDILSVDKLIIDDIEFYFKNGMYPIVK